MEYQLIIENEFSLCQYLVSSESLDKVKDLDVHSLLKYLFDFIIEHDCILTFSKFEHTLVAGVLPESK